MMPCIMVTQSFVTWPNHVILQTLNSGEERSLSAHETFKLTPYVIIGFVLSVRNVEKISQASVLERLDTFSVSTRSVPLTPGEEDVGFNQ